MRLVLSRDYYEAIYTYIMSIDRASQIFVSKSLATSFVFLISSKRTAILQSFALARLLFCNAFGSFP